jgi:ankyrin repeat protein
MVSKTSLRETVRGFQWEQLRADLAARPDLLRVQDERGRNWLHLCCGRAGGNAEDSIHTADLLLALGLGLEDAAFTEGEWQATPLWFAIAHGKNLPLAEHLLKLGSTPRYCLFAAIWNEDREAIRLLLSHGADVQEDSAPGESPLMGAVAWSKFGPAEELLEAGANPDFRNPKGDTALHLMLKKGSPIEAFRLFARHGARGDIPDAQGQTAAMILRRKRDPAFRALADELAVG